MHGAYSLVDMLSVTLLRDIFPFTNIEELYFIFVKPKHEHIERISNDTNSKSYRRIAKTA